MTTTQGGAGVSSSTTATTSGAPMPRAAQPKAHHPVNQAQAPRRGARGIDTAERQITECLNNAAAQRQSFDSCKR